jgi:drug/metabolite transporter (DMT)-like permease
MRRSADALLVFVTFVWGTTYVVVKDSLGHADPLSFLALRFGLGALLGVILLRRRLLEKALWRPAAILAVFLFGGYALQTGGLVWTSPSRGAFLTGFAVVLVPFVSRVFFKKPLAPPAIVGALVALFGLYLFTGTSQVEGSLLGDVLSLGCALVFAFHTILTERYAVKHAAFPLVGAQLVVAAALFALLVPLGPMRVDPTPALLGGVLICGIVATTVAIGLQTWAQARTTAVKTSLIYALEPLFATGASALAGGPPLSTREWVGGGLILSGVLIGEIGTALKDRSDF